jgi:plasmid stabilization system protein ParE
MTPVAERDLDAIGAYIRKDDPRAAVRFLTTLRVRLRRIGNFPKARRGVELPGYQALRQ